MKVRVFQNLDGTVRVVHPNPKLRMAGESDDNFIARIASDAVDKDPTLAGLSFLDVDNTQLPTRQDRRKWCINGSQMDIDPTRPDPPHPKQNLLNRVASANTVAELKAILIDLIKG